MLNDIQPNPNRYLTKFLNLMPNLGFNLENNLGLLEYLKEEFVLP